LGDDSILARATEEDCAITKLEMEGTTSPETALTAEELG
jgi:hypothetical protein